MSSLSELSKFLFPPDFRGRGYFVILGAYCDESEVTEKNGLRVFTVAGGLSNGAGWDRIVPPWQGVLKNYGLPYFHTTDYEARQSYYEGWDEEKRLGLITSLVECINPPIFGFACVLVLNDYDQFSEEERRAMGKPYEFCSSWLIRQVGYFLNLQKAGGMVAYVFEHRRGVGPLQKAFEEAVKTVADERRLASFGVGDKEKYPQLQVADLFAFEAGKEALRHIGAHNRPIRKSFVALEQRVHFRGYLFDVDAIRRNLDAGYMRPFTESDLVPQGENQPE